MAYACSDLDNVVSNQLCEITLPLIYISICIGEITIASSRITSNINDWNLAPNRA
jgi:hypothetical protein